MTRFKLYSSLLAISCFLHSAEATIEFIYAIKEKVHQQQGNVQPTEPAEWSYGAGASGDSGLTAVSVTLPGAGSATVIVGEDGSFDLDPDNVATQAEMDAAFPNGSVSLSVTDGGSNQDLGPFTITGDAYPNTPHITNALQLQASDHSQEFVLTWNAFTGSDADDQVLIQIWDDNANEEVIFEFLDRTATSYTIPGGTLTNDNYYDVDIIFINETDGLPDPETIIGYLSTTSYLLSTHTSDTELSFYKWQRSQQTATDLVQVDQYQALALVSGNSKTVSYAEINSPSGNYVLNSTGGNTQLLFTEFNSKAELDLAYPAGEYRFWISEDDVFTNYGDYLLPGDAYPAPPQFQNFSELLNFDASQEQSISWAAAPGTVSLVQVRILDVANTNVWTQGFDSSVTSVALPANTLNQDENYTLALRFWSPAVTNEKPPTTLGYLSSTYMDFQTSSGGGGDPGIDFAYTIKERSFEQIDNSAPVDPVEWSFGAGAQGGNDVTGGSLDYPGGNLVFTGSPGEYETEGVDYTSQAELDAAFPNGAYTLNLTVDGSGQVLGPFNITGDAYPTAPHITNIEEFRASNHTQNFTVTWNPFSEADAEDRILIIGYDQSSDDDFIFEFLEPTATSYEIPGGSLTPGNRYQFDLLFVKDTGGLETPDTIIGYISGTIFEVSTVTSDTELVFYKSQNNAQITADTIELEGYQPLALVIGNSETVTYAELNSESTSIPLNQFAPNSYIFSSPPGPKETLDASYPSGNYLFYIEEDQSFVAYDDYELPGDAYPTAPIVQNFADLQSFDSTQEQAIQWNAASADVTLISLQVRDQSNQIVWSAELNPSTTSAAIPPDTLETIAEYNLILRFWARKTGSEFPDASLGYRTVTQMPIATYTDVLDYNAWLSQFFSEEQLQDPDTTGATADPDGDKLSNDFEFLAKLDPTNPNSKLYFDFNDDSAGTLTISPVNPGVNWTVRSSADISNWTSVEPELYQLIGNEIQIDLQSFLPATFFQMVLAPAEP